MRERRCARLSRCAAMFAFATAFNQLLDFNTSSVTTMSCGPLKRLWLGAFERLHCPSRQVGGVDCRELI